MVERTARRRQLREVLQCLLALTLMSQRLHSRPLSRRLRCPLLDIYTIPSLVRLVSNVARQRRRLRTRKRLAYQARTRGQSRLWLLRPSTL